MWLAWAGCRIVSNVPYEVEQEAAAPADCEHVEAGLEKRVPRGWPQSSLGGQTKSLRFRLRGGSCVEIQRAATPLATVSGSTGGTLEQAWQAEARRALEAPDIEFGVQCPSTSCSGVGRPSHIDGRCFSRLVLRQASTAKQS